MSESKMPLPAEETSNSFSEVRENIKSGVNEGLKKLYKGFKKAMFDLRQQFPFFRRK